MFSLAALGTMSRSSSQKTSTSFKVFLSCSFLLFLLHVTKRQTSTPLPPKANTLIRAQSPVPSVTTATSTSGSGNTDDELEDGPVLEDGYFSSWGGSFRFRPAVVLNVGSVEDVVRAVRDTVNFPSPLRALGKGQIFNQMYMF